ncbi:MAG: hypothetical protein KBG30_11010, partial [Bacteroidales bacterium]|nr:hypothetical protein [Bacteroidales bacterium]
IEDVSKAVSEMADALSKLESVQKGIGGGASGGKKPKTAEFNAAIEAEKRLTKAKNELAIAEQKLYEQVLLKRNETKKQVQALSEELGITNKTTTAKKQKVKATIEETVSMQSRNQVAKLHAILSSQETTALQKLDAQMRLLNLDLQKMVSAGQTQNAEYIQKMATMKRLSNEYDKIAKASGTYAQKSMSAYGATFSLTQVMRELPNFAISSRIGFMALSNNLPMLTEDFTRLSQQIDVNTGKMLGFGGALKIFAKSLLSLNTIMIVASTLFILFADDISNAMDKLFKGKNIMDDFADSTKAVISVLDEQVGRVKSNIEAVYELGAMLQRYQKHGDSAEASVKKFNETLGINYGELNNINEVIEAYGKYAKKYIDWNIAMEAALLRVSEAAKLRADIESSKTKQSEAALASKTGLKLTPKILSDIDTQLNAYLFRKEGTSEISDTKIQEYLKDLEEDNQMISRFAKEVSIVQSKFFQQTGITVKSEDVAYIMSQRLFENLSKKRMDTVIKSIKALYPEQYVKPEPQGGGSGTTQSAKEQLEKLKMFSDERVQLLKRNNDIERDMQERSFTNEKQSFEDRLSATTEYIANLYRINKIETDMSIASANQDYDIEVEKVQKIRQENAKKLVDGKITIKEYQKSEAQNIETIERMTENHYVDLAKIVSDGELNVQAIQKQSDEKVLVLKQEHLNDLKEETDYFRNQELRRLNQAEQNAMANMKRYSFEENLVNSLFGVKKDNEIAMFQVQQNYAEARYQENKSALERQIIDTRNKGLDTLDLQKQLSDLEIEEEERKAQALIEIQNRVNDKLSELNKQMQENLIQAAQVAWDKSFERYFNQLDEKSEKFKKIEEEELQTIKDKEKAGVLTKEEADKRKEQSSKYYQSVQEQIDRDREKAERRKFLTEQAFALGQVAISTALGVAQATANSVITAGASLRLIPFIVAAGVTQGAIIAAQTIPYFAEGGVMEHTGLAVLGDGGKSELALTPQGKFFLTSNQPELHRLEKGTRIYPDASKVDINKVLSMHRGSSVAIKDDKVYNELKQTNRLLKTQKSGNFYGMPLIRQIQQGEYISQRKRGLLN